MIHPDAESILSITGAELPVVVVEGLIEDAALMVGDCIAPYSEDRQTAILKWVTAHLIGSTDQGSVIQSESVDGASHSFHRPEAGEGLRGSVYGRQALSLDTNGCLQGIGKPRPKVEPV